MLENLRSRSFQELKFSKPRLTKPKALIGSQLVIAMFSLACGGTPLYDQARESIMTSEKEMAKEFAWEILIDDLKYIDGKVRCFASDKPTLNSSGGNNFLDAKNFVCPPKTNIWVMNGALQEVPQQLLRDGYPIKPAEFSMVSDQNIKSFSTSSD